MSRYKQINNIFEEKLESNLQMVRKQRTNCSTCRIFFDVHINAFRYINAREQGDNVRAEHSQ